MSDWLVHLVRLGKIGRHPNAERLDITQVYGQSVICQKDLYREGDLAVFLPPDSVLPLDPQHPLVKDSGLEPGHCIEAKRLRGIFSNGMLVPADAVFSRGDLAEIRVGDHVAERLGITKYETPADKLATGGDNERDLGYMPKYTDIEGWAKYRTDGLIKVGDQVVITEKIHGANARFTFRDDRLWVGSHNGVKKETVFTTPQGMKIEKNLWWAVAKEINLEQKFCTLLAGDYITDVIDGKVGRIKSRVDCEFTYLEDRDLSKTVIYGEVYGQVQDLKYGITKGAQLRVFDTFDGIRGTYNDWDVTVSIAKAMGLELVPVLFRGEWTPELEDLRNGASVLYPGNIREGFVMKPVQERWQQFDENVNSTIYTGRVIFKFVGEDYKTRKRK